MDKQEKLKCLNQQLKSFDIIKIYHESNKQVLHLTSPNNTFHIVWTISDTNNLDSFECCTKNIDGTRAGLGHGSPYICPLSMHL